MNLVPIKWRAIGAVAILPLLFFAACSQGTEGEPADAARPNVLLIVVDDMGFNDLGSFGSEIETPNLDALANAGIRLIDFHVASTCSPTRSMLLTGVDHHKAGLGNMLEELSPNQKGKPGYEGFLNDRVVTLATLLGDNGYRTMMSGKWHLGAADDQSPFKRGFQQTFSLVSGGASHYADMRPAYAPSPEIKAKYRENGELLDDLPAAFDYSSQYYVDRLIDQLAQSADGKQPFFAYLAFTAPHWPLQAPDHAIAKYRGRYDEGYDVLLRERLAGAKQTGVVSERASLGPAPPKHVPWSSLDPEERKSSARAMEIYAAMIDEIDVHTGRLLDYLRGIDELENTVVFFLADNGAEGHDLDETWPADLFPDIRKTIDEAHNFSFEAMGKPGSYTLYGASWAWAGSPAFNLYKAFPTEGGTRAAAFVHYPNAFRKAAIVDDPVSVLDIAPTILDLAGVARPGDMYQGRAIEPITGISQVALFNRGESRKEPSQRVIAQELFGKRALRRGDWKIVLMPEPYGTGEWQLYNLAEDIAESNDIAGDYPQITNELVREWERYADENGVILPDWVSGY